MTTAMVSPMARPSPSTMAAMMPEAAARGHHLEHGVLVIDAESQGTLVVASGHGVQSALGHGDDGRQDHNA